jgi:cytochrome c biogenesis protein CcdA
VKQVSTTLARLLLKRFILSLSLPLLLLGTQTINAQAKLVHFLFFYDTACPVCRQIKEEYLPTVFDRYGEQVECRYVEISNNPENHRMMRGLLLKLNVPQNRQDYVPVVVIGDHVLAGEEIPDRLDETIDLYLARGGVDYASLNDIPQPVQIAVFYDPGSDAFARLDRLIGIQMKQHGPWLQVHTIDLSQPGNTDLLAQYSAALELPESSPGTPHALIGRQVLVGIDEIESQLPGQIEKHRDQGGVEIPTVDELGGRPGSARKPIYLAYFEKAGCQKCSHTAADLRLVQDDYPQLIVETFSIDDNAPLNEWLCQRYDVPEDKHLTTPMIFVGKDVLIGPEAGFGNLAFAVARYVTTGAERSWDDFDAAQAQQQMVDRFRSFGLLTVLGAGLIDGLNPCAFATLVFFVSYMTLTGRKGRDVLFVGTAFTLGVFLTYLLVGIGLLKAVQSLDFFADLGRWVYLVTALLCVTLATLTFHDFFQAQKGQASEMTLKLPARLRRRIHEVIRENAQVRAFVVMAFVTGFTISLVELACTGQVYLPTIMFVLSVPDMAAQAFLYLLLYCAAFILPLVVVFLLSYFGATSRQLGLFIYRHTAAIKGLTGLVFVTLALWMTWTLVPLFAIDAPWSQALLGATVVIVALGVAILRVRDQRHRIDSVTSLAQE